jgi:anthranilate phosphoribosyltransferase
VICGQAGADAWLDELATLGRNHIAEFYQEKALVSCSLEAGPFGAQPATLADLQGGDATANAELARRLLRGEDRGPRRDTVLLNAAAALFVAGCARTLSDGWELAASIIDEGKAAAKVEELVQAGRRGI